MLNSAPFDGPTAFRYELLGAISALAPAPPRRLPTSAPPLPPKPKLPPRSSVLYAPSAGERPYFHILKSVLVVASAAFHTSSGGFALQHLKLEKNKWNTLRRYDFWEWCIFSDYMEKVRFFLCFFPSFSSSVACIFFSHMSDPLFWSLTQTKTQSIANPASVPPYPDLFPIAAFYANCMANVHLDHDTAQSFLKRLPVNGQIRDTLEQLSFRMYEMAQDDHSPSKSAMHDARRSSQIAGTGGVRVLPKQGSVRKNAAAQLNRAASRMASQSDLPLTVKEKRPPPPLAGPEDDST